MSKRGRRWVGKLKKIKNIKNIKQAIVLKKKATKEQWNKIKLGVHSLKDIEDKMKEFKKDYEKTGNLESKDKFERIEKVVGYLKRLNTDEARKLSKEFDDLYPNQF